MDYIKDILTYIPVNEQEEQDKKVILDYIRKFPDTILTRENEFAHITSSGFILNKSLDKALMIHHNIYNKWAWTGGHVDGDDDFLHVAIKEAIEETGIMDFTPISNNIVSIDILPVYGHVKKGMYISSHMHLSIAYVLIADDSIAVKIKPDENTGVAWFSLDKFTNEYFDSRDLYLYNKIIEKAKMEYKQNFNQS